MHFARILLLQLLILAPVAAMACAIPVSTPLQYAGLYREALLPKLEYPEAMLVEGCFSQEDAPRCLAELMVENLDVIPVHASPDDTPFGALLVRYAAGSPLSAEFVEFDTLMRTQFFPHLYDEDWDYGPYFHHTLLAQDGPWHLIPVPHEKQVGWVRLGVSNLYALEAGSKVSLNEAVYVLQQADATGVTLQSTPPCEDECQTEQERKLCEMEHTDAQGKPAASGRALFVAYDELYDGDCRLILQPAYLRGC